MYRRRVPLLLATALLAACMQEGEAPLEAGTTTTTEEDGSGSTTTTGAGGFTPDPIEWDQCGDVECATLDVPLDYEDPGGDQIELYVVRTPASSKRIGALLFVNPGGPGASAAETAEYLVNQLPEDVTDHFDIVGVDPRGVGGSTPIACGMSPAELYGVDGTFEDAEDKAAYLDVSEEYVADCEAKHGDVLPHLGTPDVARDMDAVRVAMGDEQLSYLGYSYGTAIGQVYADLFPDRVRSMVLDGVVELGPTGLESADEQAAGFETALARFAQYCDAAEGCGTAGNTLQAVEDVLQLAEEPGGIPVDGGAGRVGPGEAHLGITYGLYAQSLWQTLGDALADALDGDGGGLLELAEDYHDIGAFEIYFAVNCLDFAWPVGDPDAVFAQGKATVEESPHLGEALVNDYVRCAMWPTPPVPIEPITAPGTPPILVVSTTGDPATPYESGVAVAERLENGVLVTNEGEGHGVVATGKACIDDLVAAYLVDNDVPENGTVCE